MRIKTKEDRRDRIKLPDPQARAGHRRAAAPDGVPQRRAHLRAGRGRHDRADDCVGLDRRADGQGRAAKKANGGNVAGAKAIGKTIAERLIEKGVKRVVFDRNGFLYHGRVKAVADAAREAGLEF